jgi:hypothetical protein
MAADLNNEQGLLFYGMCLYEGIGISKNETQGLKYIEKSAQMGVLMAQRIFGEYTNHPIDPCEEAEMCRIGSIKKDYIAMLEYSIILCFGYGTTQNLVDAIYWAKRSKPKFKINSSRRIEKYFKHSSLSLREKNLSVSMAEGIGFEFGIEKEQSYSKA